MNNQMDNLKRYVLFVDEEQVRTLVDAVNDLLGKAMLAQDRGKIVLYSGLLYQVKNPKEIQPKYQGWLTLMRKQILGGK